MGACNSSKGASEALVALPKGDRDIPGYAHLPAFHQLLHCGNERCAAREHFGAVISAVMPKDLQGKPAPELTTYAVHFDDQHGQESTEAMTTARRCIVEAAAVVHQAMSNGKKTLVHCQWGQNRSGAICCAYAVVYQGWSAEASIKYMRECNRRDRRYDGQQPPGGPMCNHVFNQILVELEWETRRKDGDGKSIRGAAARVRARARAACWGCFSWMGKS